MLGANRRHPVHRQPGHWRGSGGGRPQAGPDHRRGRPDLAGANVDGDRRIGPVSSQTDTEKADLRRETKELKANPEAERRELAMIYVKRGLTPELAREVAGQLMAEDALDAHARDELGISKATSAPPVQAALASAGQLRQLERPFPSPPRPYRAAKRSSWFQPYRCWDWPRSASWARAWAALPSGGRCSGSCSGARSPWPRQGAAGALFGARGRQAAPGRRWGSFEGSSIGLGPVACYGW